MSSDYLDIRIIQTNADGIPRLRSAGGIVTAVMKPIFVVLMALAGVLCAAGRPNILWITAEDHSASWLGCYGNPDAVTPRIDALAAQGLRFTHAYSNAAVCAVARSTILNGAHAVSQGTQHMRSRHRIPASFVPYVTTLRNMGYYCSNNSKTDYNFKGNDAALWDECSNRAHYRKRPENKPFFAIFNLTVSHESSLFPPNIAANRKRGIIPESPRVDPSSVKVPPYLPDLPEIRSDIAVYHDTMTALDGQVGELLDELEQFGLADDTIVFYYSDHGGIIPRGKRYLEDSGTRVPLLVRVPVKWRHLSPFAVGSSVDECVSFVDLAPTLLSLAGHEGGTGRMQGRAFLGPKRTPPPKDDVVFLYGDRFDEIPGMRRGLTDGRWKYIRCFTPSFPAAPCSYYSLAQRGWAAWHDAWKNGRVTGEARAFWEAPQVVERLYDTLEDPHEVHNLASDPAHAEKLAAMRNRLKSEMIRHRDTGLMPEAMFTALAGGKPAADYMASRAAGLPDIVDLAFTASAPAVADLGKLLEGLASDDPLVRYWSAQGCLHLGPAAEMAAPAMEKLAADANSPVRITVARYFHAIGRVEDARRLALECLQQSSGEYAALDAIQALTRMEALDAVPDAWVKRTLRDARAGEYPRRLAERLRNERRGGD